MYTIDTHHYIYKKEINWSFLNEGMSIPVSLQVVFNQNVKRFLQKGESKKIFIVIEGKTYGAELKNQKFDTNKYAGHKDIIQIRYSRKSEIACKLREIYKSSYDYFGEMRKSNPKKQISLPEGRKEYFALYTTEYPDIYYMECITSEEVKYVKDAQITEEEYEYSINYETDPKARVDIINKFVKVRRLNRAIGENLKLLYDYQCQICGKNFV